MPKWVWPVILLGALVGAAALGLAVNERLSKNRQPRIDVIPGMDHQQKYLPQAANPAFADGRAMRPAVPGAVARGELKDDDHFYRGRSGNAWAAEFPMELDREFLARGRERYDIYCATCHGYSGRGDGMSVSVEAGSVLIPANLHDQRLLKEPVGSLFNTVTNGARTMAAYAPQIPERDRWALVAYIRALQRSRRAHAADVPQEKLDAMR
jgi:mono/diheme cytochrome c family protein